MKKLVLEFDDLHFLNPENCIKEIRYLVNLFPNIKLNFFLPPCLRGTPLFNNKPWCTELDIYIKNKNVCIGRHGLYHTPEEFKYLNKKQALERLKIGDDIIFKSGLTDVKVFRGPHWGINEESIEALIEWGCLYIYNHDSYKILADKYSNNLKFKYYNLNLKDDINISTIKDDIIIAHGHTHNVCGNGISERLEHIINLFKNNEIETLFINET